MSVITFWGNNKIETAQTTTMAGIATYLFCMFIVKVSYDYNLIIKMCCLNAFYSLLWFLACSWVFCNKSSTNAYRWFKM